MESIFNDEIWNQFLQKLGVHDGRFEIKKYNQLDPYFDFSLKHDIIKNLVKDPSLKSIANHGFLPFVKVLIKTPRYRYQESEGQYGLETKIRPISYASHIDSYIYSFYSFALGKLYQYYIRNQKFDECVLAYRNDLDGKSNIQFSKEIFEVVKHELNINESCSAIAMDISGYFDNIDHVILKEKWCKIIGKDELPKDQYKVFRSLTKYSYINKNSILKHFKIQLNKIDKSWVSLLDLIPDNIAGASFINKMQLLRRKKLVTTNLPKTLKNGMFDYRGIPQGSPMSALLSNLYLIDFDKMLFDLSIQMKFTYRRYCDDILIICETAKVDDIKKIVDEEISKYKLTIQDRKTEIIDFKRNIAGKFRGFNRKKITINTLNPQNEQQYYKNLQYLGFEFNGQNIYIRPGSLSRYFRKMKGRIVKTIMMSYSDKSKIEKILKKQIFERYSHLGKRNFLAYAINASKKKYYSKSSRTYREGLDSPSIKRQISSHFAILEGEVFSKSNQRFIYKEFVFEQKKKRGKRVTRKDLKF